MDALTLFRTLTTVIGFIGFLALVVWVYRRRDEDLYPQQDLFDEQQERFPAAAFETRAQPLAQKGQAHHGK